MQFNIGMIAKKVSSSASFVFAAIMATVLIAVSMASASPVAAAQHGFDLGAIFSNIFGLPGLLSGLGLSIVGLFKLYGDLRKAIKEIGDLVAEFTAHVTDPSVRTEASQALRAIADVLSDLPMLPLTKHAQSLRDAAQKLMR
jgi:hypothetical protein